MIALEESFTRMWRDLCQVLFEYAVGIDVHAHELFIKWLKTPL